MREDDPTPTAFVIGIDCATDLKKVGAAFSFIAPGSLDIPEACGAALVASDHALDAAICVLAASDFLGRRAHPPEDRNRAEREGWIWMRARAELTERLDSVYAEVDSRLDPALEELQRLSVGPEEWSSPR